MFDLTSYLIGKHSGGDNPPILVDKTITENGTYNAVDDQADGYRSVVVEVDPTLENKTVTPTTAEQTITAGEGYDGLGTVTVNAVTATIDENIAAGNIKSGVTILGVTGSYEGTGVQFSATPATFTVVSNISNLNADIPNGVTSIGTNAFYGCTGLTSVKIPSSVTSIGTNAFNGCTGLTSVEIPSSVTSIGTSAFIGCIGLTSVKIPSSVTSIPNNAFYGCTGLTSITIPNSVTNIGSSAFYNCYALGFIKFDSTTPPVIGNSSTFGNIPTDCIIYVPEGTLEAYTSATNYPDDSVYTYVEY